LGCTGARTRTCESTDAKAGVLAVFDAYIDYAELGYEHGFRGCGLLNAAVELPVGSLVVTRSAGTRSRSSRSCSSTCRC